VSSVIAGDSFPPFERSAGYLSTGWPTQDYKLPPGRIVWLHLSRGLINGKTVSKCLALPDSAALSPFYNFLSHLALHSSLFMTRREGRLGRVRPDNPVLKGRDQIYF
jgi:hypothetical protein